jgi:hypothetical protein
MEIYGKTLLRLAEKCLIKQPLCRLGHHFTGGLDLPDELIHP